MHKNILLSIPKTANDAGDFVVIVEQLVNGLLSRESPQGLILIKTDGWFGLRWLGFSGKILGAMGVRKTRLTIPPFVPDRIVEQRNFDAPNYMESEPIDAVHISCSSRKALNRYADTVSPNKAIVWYSGNSGPSGRGSVMAYVPASSGYTAWYLGYAADATWRITEFAGISQNELNSLLDHGRELTSVPNA
jgi:hypothetical protein